MIRVPRLALLAYLLAIVVIALDQALKYWVLDVYRLPERLSELAASLGTDRPSITVLGPFHLTLVSNRGVSFGFMNVEAPWTRWALTLFSLGVAVALAVWAWRLDRLILALSVGLIMGGAVGNAIDRIHLGAVTDFLDFSSLRFPWVFNIADSAISIGSALLVWDLFLAPRKRAGG